GDGLKLPPQLFQRSHLAGIAAIEPSPAAPPGGPIRRIVSEQMANELRTATGAQQPKGQPERELEHQDQVCNERYQQSHRRFPPPPGVSPSASGDDTIATSRCARRSDSPSRSPWARHAHRLSPNVPRRWERR